jgi:hypothetical protein
MFTENQRYHPLGGDDLLLMSIPGTDEKAVWVRPETALTQLLFHICRSPGFPVDKMGDKQWIARRSATIEIPDKLKPSIRNWPRGRSQLVFVCHESGVPSPSQLNLSDDTAPADGWQSGSLLSDTWHDWFQPDVSLSPLASFSSSSSSSSSQDESPIPIRGVVQATNMKQQFPEKKSTSKGRVIKSFNYIPPSGNLQGPSEDLFTIPLHPAPGNWPADPSVYNPYGQGPSTPFSP